MNCGSPYIYFINKLFWTYECKSCFRDGSFEVINDSKSKTKCCIKCGINGVDAKPNGLTKGKCKKCYQAEYRKK